MIDTATLPGPFQVELPEVYQIEVSSACNLKCIMCPRTLMPRRVNSPFITFDLVKKIIDQGDLDRSYFVELQMSGEPLLHPNLLRIIKMIKLYKPNLLLGLSTNGILIRDQIESLKLLDYITVSVDSLSSYESIRRGGIATKLVEDIFYLLDNLDLFRTTVDLQLIELPGWEKELEKVKALFEHKKVNIRTVPDCFLTMFDVPTKVPVKKEVCLNPWLSCSIQSSGSVVPCCFCFGDGIVLGNIKEKSLREIWQGEEIRKLRESFTTGHYTSQCSKCYMRSPALLHWQIYMNSLRRE